MLFHATKTRTGHQYVVEDVFGIISIVSPEILEPDRLDLLASSILRSGYKHGTINKTISFTFEKRPLWEEDEVESLIQ